MFTSKKSTSENKSLVAKGAPFILDSRSQIKADLVLNSDIRIDGVLEGNVTTTGNLIIGEQGSLTGKVISKNFYLSGYFSGEADVATRSVIHATGKYFGKIATEIINIESGGVVNGSISMRNFVSHKLTTPAQEDRMVTLVEETKTAKVRVMPSPVVEEVEEESFLLKNLVGF